MYGLKRRLEIEAERKKKREEKERIKKEKEAEKKRLKKIERKKKLKRANSKRYYTKLRKKELEEREKNGDEYAYYSVYIAQDRRKIRFIGTSWWKSDAYKIYNDAIERNRKKATFPKTTMTNRKSGAHETVDTKYEILLVKKTEEGEDTTSYFRNEDGKYIDTTTDWENHVIVDKADWYVEETFGVYGYHPVKDRKTYRFILNEVLLKDDDVSEEMKSVLVFKNRVIFSYLDDFDLITCYDNEQAKKMYDMLQEDVLKLGKKYIVFMGETTSTKWLDKIQEKTGWNRYSIMHNKTAN